MAGSSFIAVPPNINDSLVLKRFLDTLVLKLDEAFGNRGSNEFATVGGVNSEISSIQELIVEINKENATLVKLDGSREITGVLKYSGDLPINEDKEIPHNKHLKDNYEPIIPIKNSAFNKNFGTTADTVTEGGTTTNNPMQADIANLGLTISNPPTQAQVQAVADKVDSILVALRNANIIG